MMCRRGLTLIEVLLAVVLLAMMAAVVAPYLRAPTRSSGVRAQSDFSAAVGEAIAGVERTHAQHPTREEITPAIIALGAVCMSVSEPDEALHGQWVSIADGSEQVLYWVRAPKREEAQP